MLLHCCNVFGTSFHGGNVFDTSLHCGNVFVTTLHGGNVFSTSLHGSNVFGTSLHACNVFGTSLHSCNVFRTFLQRFHYVTAIMILKKIPSVCCFFCTCPLLVVLEIFMQEFDLSKYLLRLLLRVYYRFGIVSWLTDLQYLHKCNMNISILNNVECIFRTMLYTHLIRDTCFLYTLHHSNN